MKLELPEKWMFLYVAYGFVKKKEERRKRRRRRSIRREEEFW